MRRRSGLSLSKLHAMEHGHANLKLSDALALGKAYNYSPRIIFFRDLLSVGVKHA